MLSFRNEPVSNLHRLTENTFHLCNFVGEQMHLTLAEATEHDLAHAIHHNLYRGHDRAVIRRALLPLDATRTLEIKSHIIVVHPGDLLIVLAPTHTITNPQQQPHTKDIAL